MEKQDDVAVLDDVVFAFEAGFAGLAGSDPAFVFDHVVVGDDLGSDEAFFDIAVDFSCGDRGCGSFLDGPGPCFDIACGDVGDEAEELEGFFDEAV